LGWKTNEVSAIVLEEAESSWLFGGLIISRGFRETITWFDKKLSGYTNDLDVYNAVDKNMGRGISWNPGPDISGGTLHLKSISIDLVRIPSTVNSPGTWQ
jgi:hypothetical protein